MYALERTQVSLPCTPCIGPLARLGTPQGTAQTLTPTLTPPRAPSRPQWRKYAEAEFTRADIGANNLLSIGTA